MSLSGTKTDLSNDYVIENLEDANFKDTFQKSASTPNVPFLYSTVGTVNRLRDRVKIVTKSDPEKLSEN